MWSLADRRSLIMTPRTVICCTRSMSRHNGGKFCDFLAVVLCDWNVISLHLLACNRKLYSLAHSWTCCNSFSQVWLLSAAMTKYVSLGNRSAQNLLHSWVFQYHSHKSDRANVEFLDANNFGLKGHYVDDRHSFVHFSLMQRGAIGRFWYVIC